MDHGSFPAGLHMLAIASLAIAPTCAIVIALDELRRNWWLIAAGVKEKM